MRHKITNTIVCSDLVIGHASPFTAVTWSAHSWCKLSSLGDVRHAVGLEKVEVGTGINGAGTRGRPHVCVLVCAYVLSNSHVARIRQIKSSRGDIESAISLWERYKDAVERFERDFS